MKKTTFIVKTNDGELKTIDAILLGTKRRMNVMIGENKKKIITQQVVYAQNRIAEITTVVISTKGEIYLQQYDIKTKVEYIDLPDLNEVLQGIKQPEELWNEDDQLAVNMLKPSTIEKFLKNLEILKELRKLTIINI